MANVSRGAVHQGLMRILVYLYIAYVFYTRTQLTNEKRNKHACFGSKTNYI